jgi:hypothetical protein
MSESEKKDQKAPADSTELTDGELEPVAGGGYQPHPPGGEDPPPRNPFPKSPIVIG